jgi:hypothetical protein
MLPLLSLPLSVAEDDEDAEKERRLMAELDALKEKRLRNQLQELQNKRQRREQSLTEHSRQAPTDANPYHGTVVAIDNGPFEFAVQDDVNSKLWWFPNVAEITRYRTLNGPKLFVKKRAAPHDTVEITYESDFFVADPDDNPPPVLKFEVGTAVTFVPYERSELLSNVDGRLVMHHTNEDRGTDYTVTVPMGCAGVATQIGVATIPHPS